MASSLKSLLEGRFTWSKKTGRYRDKATGFFVSEETVENAIRAEIVTGYKERTEALGQLLIDRQINFPEFAVRMRAEIKKGHSLAGVLGYGGFEQMTPAKWGRIGVEVRENYKKLDNFIREMERAYEKELAGALVIRKKGEVQPLDGTARFRAGLYAKQILETYSIAVLQARIDAGHTQARRFLRPAEHCRGCFDEANKGWIPIAKMTPICGHECHGNDQCFIRTRKAKAASA